ncbi:MAG: TRIC cation channel family protein [Clostridia bacterium]|nr:TRIC cation channel family protein [Clostridia bacterium]
MAQNILLAIEIIGVISFAVAGAIVAIDKETDIFGVVFLSLMTCFGGGIIRDITIGRHPPAFFRELWYQVLIAIGVALLVFILAMLFKKQYVQREHMVLDINNYIDALAIGIFSVSGVQTCLDFFATKGQSAGFIVCATLGMMSAVGGGMVRDLILRDIPFILRKRVYALAALIGASVYYILVVKVFDFNEVAKVISQVGCIALVVLIRVLATKLKWNLPKAIKFSELREDEAEKDA